MLVVLQGANWQRGGGKGEKPKRIERPRDDTPIVGVRSAADLAEKKQRLRQERERRANQAK